MQRPFFLIMVVSFVFISCSQKEDEQQRTATDKAVSVEQTRASSYVCPMHPAVTSDQPGKCPKCGMDLVETAADQHGAEHESINAQTAPEKIKAAKRLIADAKRELIRNGSYRCCIEDPCSQCALDHYNCPCRSDLKKGKPVCNECYAGWQRGEGIEEGIDPKSVKTTFSPHKH